MKKMANTTKMFRLAGYVTFYIITCLVTGCAAVGPDYNPPELNWQMDSWSQNQEAGMQPSKAEVSEWWKKFDDEKLNRLIAMTLENNLDLQQAHSRLREARAQRNISQAATSPSLNLSGSASRQKVADASSGSLYSSGFDAAWELDLFGRVRRSLEASSADLMASEESLRDVQISLLAEVALNYVNVRSAQDKLRLALVNVDLQEETHNLIKNRVQLGLASELELKEGESNLANTEAQIPAIKASLSMASNRLSVLVGEKPGSLGGYLREPAIIPVAPPEIPIGVPADLLRRRPDIRQAERQLAAQTARVGVATADLYPRFSLNGVLSFQSTQSTNLFNSLSRLMSLGPALQWNIFNAGSVRNSINVQNERQQQALLNYEKRVLTALEEVENSLVSYARELDRRQKLEQAVAASKEAVSLAKSMYTEGLRDFSHVLDTQRTLFSQENDLATSNAEVTGNLIRLYKVLGGGWQAPQSSNKSK